ncbi:MAG: alpha/beta hydrolase [Robiginitomaculum sp.]|nr:MAG: alpha/beta hydrolase [Robiginitomaculum sp.]
MKNEITPGDVIRLEGLDLPPGATFHYVQNGDVRLRVMTVPAARADARGSIIFQPGRTEFIEKYFEMAQDLTARGFAVLILDPRGQGLSSRLLEDPMKSYVEDYEDYCDDLAFVTQAFKNDLPRPHIVMGHSMGGTIGLQTILTGRLNPAACVFTAPMLELQDLETPFMRLLVKGLTWAGLGQRNLPFQAQRAGLPVPFRTNKLTSDPNRYQLWATYFENHKRLRVGAPTFGWISASLRAMKFVNENARHLNIPTLIIACGADPIVKPVSNHEFAKAAHADFFNVAGALHEIFMERDEYRDQFWDAFDAFLEKNAL